MSDPGMVIPFLIGGGVLVGLAAALLALVITGRLERFEHAHRQTDEKLDAVLRMLAEALSLGDRATLVASEVAFALDRQREEARRATIARELTGRRATIARLRRARARAARRGGSE
jgi:hypothetical protein